MKLLKLKFRIVILLFLFLSSLYVKASETATERAIIKSIKEFSSDKMSLSFVNLWGDSDVDVYTKVWGSIKSSGKRWNINWSNISYYDSFQKTISYNGKLYNAGVLIIRTNQRDYASLGIIYLVDDDGYIVNMRDNWSQELKRVPSKAIESMEQLVDRWLSSIQK